MKCQVRILVAVTLLGVLAGCGEAPAKKEAEAAAADIGWFQNVRLIPGDGSPAIQDAFVTVENGKITKIGSKAEVPAPKGALHVDLAGQTIMPVLVNLHGHVGLIKAGNFSTENYSRESVLNDVYRYGYYGVEYVASLGTDTDVAFSVRDEQRQGKLSGGQLYTAGRGITTKGGWPTPILKGVPMEVGTEAEARKAVNDMAAKKVDLIKIWVDDNMGALPKLNPALSAAIIDEAHKKNLKVVAHVFYLADAKDLVKAGVDGLVHSIRDHEVDDDLINQMKAKNVIYTPTLTAHESKFVYVDKPSWLGEQSMREVFPAQLSAFTASDVFLGKMRRDPNLPKFREQYAMAQKNLKKMAAAGVKIGLGTDSGAANTFTGYFEHRELELMEAAGMAPADIIKTTTATSAEFLGIKDGGVLAPGKNANFLVLTANPLDKARNSREIFTIYMNGHEIDRAAMLRNITTEVPKITEDDRKKEAVAAADFARIEADKKLPHFGDFPAADATIRIAGMAIPMPKYSKETHKAGPPHVITVSLDKATGGQLAEFYKTILPQRGWAAAGACFERKGVVSSKMQSLCMEPAGNQITLNISEK